MTEQQAAQALVQSANQIAQENITIANQQKALGNLQTNHAKHKADYLAAAGPGDREFVFGTHLITIKAGVVSIVPIPPGGIVISPLTTAK